MIQFFSHSFPSRENDCSQRAAFGPSFVPAKHDLDRTPFVRVVAPELADVATEPADHGGNSSPVLLLIHKRPREFQFAEASVMPDQPWWGTRLRRC